MKGIIQEQEKELKKFLKELNGLNNKNKKTDVEKGMCEACGFRPYIGVRSNIKSKRTMYLCKHCMELYRMPKPRRKFRRW